MLTRCAWAKDPLYIGYHDKEWGTPLHDDKALFEMLVLEGAQAGLSWSTVLKRRDSYRRAFSNFDPERVASYGARDAGRLLKDKGIIRNKNKISSTINNAKRFLEVQKEFGSFDKYAWSFVNNQPIVNRRKNLEEIPAKTPLSDQLSKDLKRRGFSFVGSTICYAYMQAVGMVNDHTVDCFRYNLLSKES